MQKYIRDLLFFSSRFVSFFKWTKLQVTSVSGRRKNAFLSHAVGWQPVPEHLSLTVNGEKGSTGWPCSGCSLLPLLALGFHVGVLWYTFVLFALKINEKGQCQRWCWHWLKDLNLHPCWEALHRDDIQGEILLSLPCFKVTNLHT